VDPGWERGWVIIGIETCIKLAHFQNINNNHCFESYEYSISQVKTKEEINVTMDKKNKVLLYFITFLIYREVTMKFIQNLYYGS